MTDPPGAHVDPAALDDLLEQVGDPQIVMLIITTFLDGVDARLEALKQGATRDDHELLGRTAHSLKSAAALVGLHGLRVAAQALEFQPADPERLEPVQRGLAASTAALRLAHEVFAGKSA